MQGVSPGSPLGGRVKTVVDGAIRRKADTEGMGPDLDLKAVQPRFVQTSKKSRLPWALPFRGDDPSELSTRMTTAYRILATALAKFGEDAASEGAQQGECSEGDEAPVGLSALGDAYPTSVTRPPDPLIIAWCDVGRLRAELRCVIASIKQTDTELRAVHNAASLDQPPHNAASQSAGRDSGVLGWNIEGQRRLTRPSG